MDRTQLRDVLSRVDDELRAIWASRPAPGQTPTARARTANLVVVAANPSVAGAWRPIIDDVVQNVPARAIVVGLDPDAPDGLEADVSAVCSAATSGSVSICSERVSLSARGSVCGRIASVIGTLCLGDVTTTLVWLGRVRADDPAFAPLAADAGRIVLDATEGSVNSLASVVHWTRTRPARDRPGVADLCWTRIAPWQEFCARLFDEPRLSALASKVTSVSVTQASEAGAPLGAEATLLIAWLATRLSWKAVPLAGKLRLLRADGSPIRVSLRADAAAPGSGEVRRALRAVRLEAQGDELSMSGDIVREDATASWARQVAPVGGEPHRLLHHVRWGESQMSGLLERTLRRPVRDEALVDAITWADGLRGEELSCT